MSAEVSPEWRPEGYTLVRCSAPGCATDAAHDTSAVLRDCVRTSRHAVLVLAGCALGPVICRLRTAGPMVIVQPCDEHRRPTRPAIRVGPIRDDDDLAAVRDWLRTGRPDPALLPAHLTGLHRAAGAAANN